MSRPIEPGCKVEILPGQGVDDKDVGNVVTAERAIITDRGYRVWVTDYGKGLNGDLWCFTDSALRRIDEYGGDEVTSWDECVWRPEVVA